MMKKKLTSKEVDDTVFSFQKENSVEDTKNSNLPLPLGLYVVATPIGNLSDITFRAIDILQRVDLIAAEDTRITSRLLSHFQIHRPLLSLHTHNETDRIETVIARLRQNQRIALVSDAGTPAISDPGARLVAAAKDLGFSVFPIPGPSAVITAISAIGWSGAQFLFYGFLPSSHKPRVEALISLRNLPYPVVYYEAPHRILEMLSDILENYGPSREIVLAKELTKRYETIVKMFIPEIIDWLTTPAQEARQKGEFVIIVLPEKKELQKEEISEKAQEIVITLLKEGIKLKQAVSIAAQLTKEKKNKIYEFALSKNKEITILK